MHSRHRLLAAVVLVLSACSTTPALERHDAGWVKAHSSAPEEYVISKFRDHDIVFVGELHRVRHDVLFIQDLIPRLYAAGIYNLGIEFGVSEYQDKADALVTADRYDQSTARWLMFQSATYWGYQEYEDLYRAA